MMKICFLAPSGYGKTTAISILSKQHKLKNIKIAEPLYDMQNEFYKKLGVSMSGQQDGELLQFLGQKIRKENKYFLLDIFKEKMNEAQKESVEIISNDDCRPADYQFLKDLGFIFVRINGYKHDREDHTPVDSNHALEWKSNIPCDYEINNTGTIGDYEVELEQLLLKILNTVSKCYIFPTVNLCNCSCKFCISKTRDFSGFPNFLEEISIENLYLLKKRKIKRFEITGGGEPMLNKNLQNIIDRIREVIPDAYIKLYTNSYILRKINDIDELNLSIAYHEDEINDNIMQPNKKIPLKERLQFFKDNYSCKKRISLVIANGGVDTPQKLKSFIETTKHYVDEYVVRTIYNGTIAYDDFAVDFDCDCDVIWERDNTGKGLNNLILATDNFFYGDLELRNKRYLYSYLMLKPDSQTYLIEILDMIKENRLNISKIYYIKDFKEFAPKLYYLKHKDYFSLVTEHIKFTTHLFGNKGLILLLDGDCSIEELLYKTYRIKQCIRREYSLTGGLNTYISHEGNNFHLNLLHCPDIMLQYFDKDLDIIYDDDRICELKDEILLSIMKNYRTYHIIV